MDVYLYAMNKRENATTQPSGSGNHVDGIVLKEPCSIMEPVLKFAMNAGADPIGYNYMYIPAFERFYWIRDWVAEPGYNWVAHCKVDVLATYAAAIGNSYQYILRSSNASDPDIIDELYPATGSVTTLSNVSGSAVFDRVVPETGQACYVVGIINNDVGYPAARIGAVTYYAFTPAGIQSLMNWLMDPGSLTGFVSGDSGLTTSVYKSLYNPMQYIVSCMFCPITPGVGTNISTIGYGPYSHTLTGGACYYVNAAAIPMNSGSVAIPKHPQASTRGRYLNMAPYSQYQVEIKPFGWIPIDPASLQGYDYLYWRLYFDPITGQGTLLLSVNTAFTSIVYEQTAMIGVPASLAQTSRDWLGGAMSVVGGIAGAASGVAMGNVPGAIASGISALGNTANSLKPQVQTAGGTGSYADLIMSRFLLVGRFLLVVDEDNDDLGRPYCHYGKISDTGGYLLIANPDIGINEATQAEMQEIKRYMAGGFFYV